MIQDKYPEFIKNISKSIRKRQQPNEKTGKGHKQKIHRGD